MNSRVAKKILLNAWTRLTPPSRFSSLQVARRTLSRHPGLLKDTLFACARRMQMGR